MKAILVKYLPATDTKGVRLKVSAQGVKPLTIPRDYELTPYEQAERLAALFCSDMDWDYKLHGGELPSGDYCFTMEV